MPNIEKDFSYVDEWKSMWEPDLEAIAYNGATCDPTRVHPKVLQWAKENCAHEPKFVKVIGKSASKFGWHGLRGSKSHSQFKITVPRPFVRQHYKELGRVVTLENGISHKKWKVSFGTAKLNSSWLQGWRRVADDNSLFPGDVMIFVLVGHSHFRFHVFDKDGNFPGTNRKLQNCNAGLAKTEPRRDTHQEEHALTDSEDEFQRKKLRRLFDPDLAIVKLEPGLFQSTSPENGQPPYDQYLPAQCETPTVLPGFQSSPDSELTKRTFMQSDEGCEGNPVNRKLEFDSTKNLKPVEAEESPSASNGMITQQKFTSLQVQRPPVAHELPINPLNYFVVSKRRMTTPTERIQARDAAEAYASTLVGCACFVLVMSETQVYSDFHLRLSDKFVLESSFPTGRTRFRLVDWNGSKSWEMYSMKNSRNEVAFHRKYWSVFSLEHFLEEGDVCVFQLTNKDTFTISVRIFRVLQLPKYFQGRPGTVHDHYEIRPKPNSWEVLQNTLS